jgi:hypothetical protein
MSNDVYHSGLHFKVIYDKTYFITVHLLVGYISVNIPHCTNMEHIKIQINKFELFTSVKQMTLTYIQFNLNTFKWEMVVTNGSFKN